MALPRADIARSHRAKPMLGFTEVPSEQIAGSCQLCPSKVQADQRQASWGLWNRLADNSPRRIIPGGPCHLYHQVDGKSKVLRGLLGVSWGGQLGIGT